MINFSKSGVCNIYSIWIYLKMNLKNFRKILVSLELYDYLTFQKIKFRQCHVSTFKANQKRTGIFHDSYVGDTVMLVTL